MLRLAVSSAELVRSINLDDETMKKQVMVLALLAVTLVAAIPQNAQAAELRGLAGKCLDVDQNQARDGAKVQIWECNGTPAQQWLFNPKSGEIRGPGGKCLDVDNAGTADGTRVQLFQCNGTNAQRWRYVKGELRGIASKCLDVDGANTEDGTPVQLWECNGTNAQSWVLPR